MQKPKKKNVQILKIDDKSASFRLEGYKSDKICNELIGKKYKHIWSHGIFMHVRNLGLGEPPLTQLRGHLNFSDLGQINLFTKFGTLLIGW